jgi:chemotaxis signal transduction protein
MTTSVCVFSLPDGIYALDVALVGEVVPATPPVPLPRCPPAVLGLAELRGQALAHVDLGRLLDLPDTDATPAHLLVLRRERPLAVVPIQGFTGVLPADPALRRAPNRQAERPWIAGFQEFTAHPGLTATLIDSDALLDRFDTLRFNRPMAVESVDG